MEKFLVSELLDVFDGQLEQEGTVPFITSASIDSRTIAPGGLYIPIIGESMDGHQFIQNAIDNGAVAVLTQQPDCTAPEEITVIRVDSTKDALQALGRANRHRYHIPVVAVTGSSGKTTTKDVIAAVLSQKCKTMKTQGNYNNQLGVPQTLFQLDGSYGAAVVEMGMDHLGDIRETIDEVTPHYAVITNIGTAHLEFLKTQENILKAKMEILETMGEGDYAILNGDDPYLNRISETPYRIIRIGIDSDALDYRAENIESSSEGVRFTLDGEAYHFRFPGIHNVYNAMAAIVIAKDLELSQAQIQGGFDAFVPSGNRMKVETIGGITYIDDSYNANPDSMRAASNTLRAMGEEKGRCIAVIGDMLEMGETGWELHRKVGETVGEIADILIAVGDLAKAYVQGASGKLPAEAIHHCEDAVDAALMLKNIAAPGDTVLIKASHGVHLEKIMESVKEED
ncbi:UDP-N-acetylmuramoyl-tripeptide--D-alanyl-D-alanine ligase [Eubacterium barkeri]|uniref:UDP-N-acetylmuramoyl-tripeptide--D-alanyl-D-alanine ligase n=1 Tax=Eubacterium barkeri TaxID=1528 RepID=A0A1H3EG78_EUBBA|nr:UDP-N-acetylmuramoyl-tripeptide--D-alanyl-D-alanine ligase [Eubacterium barkeri]SDX77218.1 UDP-N-acetylmuramoyl-tripeptide--D-alanyl-D-alanine ligase [Eubacterium barkeri]